MWCDENLAFLTCDFLAWEQRPSSCLPAGTAFKQGGQILIGEGKNWEKIYSVFLGGSLCSYGNKKENIKDSLSF